MSGYVMNVEMRVDLLGTFILIYSFTCIRRRKSQQKKLGLIEMKLPQKHKENFDVLSEGVTSYETREFFVCTGCYMVG